MLNRGEATQGGRENLVQQQVQPGGTGGGLVPFQCIICRGKKKEADEFQIKQDEQLHSENSHSGAILGRVS